jgi:putative ATP-dependent endonuclease of OLD family
MQSGSDIYISRIIRENLEDKEKIAISQAHRQMREAFMRDDNVKAINKKISSAAKITSKEISISVDLASQNAWESTLMTYIDSIPFQHIGKGEQCVIKTKLALSNKKTSEATILLIEEPENHLSHSKMSRLIRDLSADNGQKQIIMTTHSSFVANKLGLEHLVLLRDTKTVRIAELAASDFFKKLSGYDTLRLVLSSKCILVEGDSDELIVQRAYIDANGKLPIEDEIDVVSVGTSFLRFLELAERLKIPTSVVTDNDGDPAGIGKKYSAYSNNPLFKICCDMVVDSGPLEVGKKPYNYNTLEPKLLKENSRELFNRIFGTKYETDDDLQKYMTNNKTECALAIFSTAEKVTFPDYIRRSLS